MPMKLSYDYVKKYIEGKGYELISKEYINNSEKLKIKCKCGNIYNRSFYHFQKGMVDCLECKNEKVSKQYRTPIEEILQKIKENNCEYIDGKYINNKSKLRLRCECNNVFIKDMAHFLQGQNRCQECGKNNSINSKIKYTEEDVQKIVLQKGFILIGKYLNSYTPFKVQCKKGHQFDLVFTHYLNNHAGCKECANQNLRGEKHWNYKGGESEVLDYFRKNIKQWKFDVMKSNGFKCFFTDSKKDLVIHHLKSFNTIIKDSCKELDIPLNRKIKDYDEKTFEKLKEKVFSKHNLNIGITLQRKVHNKFHSIYGLGDNTEEQFKEFVQKYYPNKIKDFKDRYNLI